MPVAYLQAAARYQGQHISSLASLETLTSAGDCVVWRVSVQTHLFPFSADRAHISMRCNALRAFDLALALDIDVIRLNWLKLI